MLEVRILFGLQRSSGGQYVVTKRQWFGSIYAMITSRIVCQLMESVGRMKNLPLNRENIHSFNDYLVDAKDIEHAMRAAAEKEKQLRHA